MKKLKETESLMAVHTHTRGFLKKKELPLLHWL